MTQRKVPFPEIISISSGIIDTVKVMSSGIVEVSKLPREGSITHFSLSFTGSGVQTVYTPSSNKKASVIGFLMSSYGDAQTELKFGTSGNIIAALPTKGTVAMNLLGLNSPTGNANETVVVSVTTGVTVKGWINVVEI